jgi:plastocyanin
MQSFGRVLLASAFVLSACAGGDTPGDTTAAAAPESAGTTSAAPAAAAPAVTGATHEVQMTFENGVYKFVPDKITVKAGDAIKFINVSGGPHNVHFKDEDTPDDMESIIARNMPAEAAGAQKLGPMSGPLLTQPNETYTVSFADIKPGDYPFVCTPHEALGMKGTVTVTQ